MLLLLGLLVGADDRFVLLSFFSFEGGHDDDWVAHMDPETRKTYYANEATGHSTWTEHPQRV